MKNNTWIIVVNKKEARIFSKNNEGIREETVLINNNNPGKEHGRHVLGRVSESKSSTRHIIEPYDETDHEISAFAGEVADYLDETASNSNYTKLVIVAPPKTLGAIRKVLSKKVKELVSDEVNKDFANMNAEQILHNLKEHIVV